MKVYFLMLSCATLLLASVVLTAVAEDDSTPAEAKLSEQAQAAKAEFDQRFGAWRTAIREIDELRIKFQTADETTREQLQEKLQEKFDQASEMIPGIVEVARTGFEADPNTDKKIKNFLLAVAAYYVSSDRYDEALPVIESLLSYGEGHDWLYVWAGVAAYAVADYDKAETHIKKLQESGFLDAPPRTKQKTETNLWGLAKQFQENTVAYREAWEKEQSLRIAEAEADDLPRVVLKTNRGDITIELLENEAPNAVKNFITLIENGFYDGLTFHRVLPNFMAQGGCPDGTGMGGPGYHIPCECHQENARHHFRGTLSMAHAGRDTGGSQFFITFLPTPQLDGRHTAFGRVIDGFDVLAKIRRRDPDSRSRPPKPDKIIKAEVVRKRPGTDYGEFEKKPGK